MKWCKDCKYMRMIKFLDTGEEDMFCDIHACLVTDDQKYNSARGCEYYREKE